MRPQVAVDLRTLTLSMGGPPGTHKCPALVWREGVPGGPLVYFRKPKHVTQEDFNEIINAMRVSVVVEGE